MRARPSRIRDVIIVQLPTHTPPGREQEGYRPAIVVGPEQFEPLRFSMLIVVPVTTDRGQEWAVAAPTLYPCFAAGAGRLPSPSIALLDQICSLDTVRVVRRIGTLTPGEYRPVLDGLCRMLGPDSP